VTLQFSPDGRWLHITHRAPENALPSHAALWELNDGKIGRKVVLEHRCAFSPDSQLVAGARPDGSIGVYEVASGREIKCLAQGLRAVRVWFSPNGRELAVTVDSSRHLVAILDLETGEEVGPGYEHEAPVNDVAWRGDGRLLGIACNDQRIYIWDHAQQQLQSVLEGHAGLGLVIGFSPGSGLLISTSWDGSMLLWDPVTGRQLLRGHSHFVDIRSDGRQVAVIDPENRLALWEMAGELEYRTLHHGMVGNRTLRPTHWGPTSSDFSRDGRLFVTSHLDGVRLWDLATFKEVGHLPVSPTASVRFHPDGNSLFTYNLSGVYRWPLERDSTPTTDVLGGIDVIRIDPPESLNAPGNWAHAELYNDPAGRTLAAVDHAGGRALLFQLDDLGKKLVLAHPNISGCLVSPDGRWVCTSTRMDPKVYSVKVWDTTDGTLVWQLPPEEIVGYFTPDSRWLVTVPSKNEPLRLWEVGSWQAGPTMPRHSVKQIAMWHSPDGTVLIPAELGPPRFIHAATGKELAQFEAPHDYGGQAGARFSPDGAWLASSTGNHSIHLWDLDAVRHGLIELGLDWDSSSYRPPGPKGDTRPIRIEIPGEVQTWANVERKVARGYSLAQWGRTDEALAAIDDAIQLKPDDAKARTALAWLLSFSPDRKFRDPQRALVCAREAVALDSQGPLPWQVLGGALYRTGEWEESIDALERSIFLQNDGGGPAQWFILAMAHCRMGNNEMAAKWYDQSVRWLEVNEDAPEELRRLRSEAAALLATTDKSDP
jgi:WD40 repeat protein